MLSDLPRLSSGAVKRAAQAVSVQNLVLGQYQPLTVPAPHRRTIAPHRELSLWNWHKLNSASFLGVCRRQVSLRASPIGWAI